jgi:hypothetical protein
VHLVLLAAVALGTDDPRQEVEDAAMEVAFPARSKWTLVRVEQGENGWLDGRLKLKQPKGCLILHEGCLGELDLTDAGDSVGFAASYGRTRFDLNLVGRDFPGICEFDGERLRVCVSDGKGRPSRITLAPGDHNLILVFKLK